MLAYLFCRTYTCCVCVFVSLLLRMIAWCVCLFARVLVSLFVCVNDWLCVRSRVCLCVGLFVCLFGSVVVRPCVVRLWLCVFVCKVLCVPALCARCVRSAV